MAGGSLEDCRLVSGEVCSLQLVHKGMAGTIQQPRIALVANSIMFQRDEGRFVSLDTLAMQEEEYIKNVTGRLLASQPSVVLVERTVSRLAQVKTTVTRCLSYFLNSWSAPVMKQC